MWRCIWGHTSSSMHRQGGKWLCMFLARNHSALCLHTPAAGVVMVLLVALLKFHVCFFEPHTIHHHQAPSSSPTQRPILAPKTGKTKKAKTTSPPATQSPSAAKATKMKKKSMEKENLFDWSVVVFLRSSKSCRNYCCTIILSLRYCCCCCCCGGGASSCDLHHRAEDEERRCWQILVVMKWKIRQVIVERTPLEIVYILSAPTGYYLEPR